MSQETRNRPFLVVRAQVDARVRPRFEQWYREVHLPRVLKIPGIVKAHRLRPSGNAVNFMAVYEFQDETVIRGAMSSPEATQARDSWTQWADYVTDLSAEVYAVLSPWSAFHQRD